MELVSHCTYARHVCNKDYTRNYLTPSTLLVIHTTGELTDEVLDKSNTPYLHAVIRESHRVIPISPILIAKRMDKQVDRYGMPMEVS